MQEKGLSLGRNLAISTSLLEELMRLHPRVIDLSLDRVQRLLHVLGHPEDNLPPAVHIAGTNGKGSIVAYLRAFLEAANLTVHTYTSPHLVHFNERIRLAGVPIEDSMLLSLLKEVERVNANQPITLFEIVTCAAFLIFSRVHADVVLLETGLGGRLDATNVLKRPILTILTSISIDHEQYLGKQIEAITLEKSYILKPGIGCVIAKQDRAVSHILEMRSLEIGVPVWREGCEWHIHADRNYGIIFSGANGSVRLPIPALPGTFQIHNAGLAIAAVEHLPFDIPISRIITGLQKVNWPGRLQCLTYGPLVRAVTCHGWEIWIDGGHNPSAGKALAQHMRIWCDKPLALIIGMLRTKDARGFIIPLISRVTRIRTVAIPITPDSYSARSLANLAIAYGHSDTRPAKSLRAAVSELSSGSTGRILITGSLHLVGHILSKNC